MGLVDLFRDRLLIFRGRRASSDGDSQSNGLDWTVDSDSEVEDTKANHHYVPVTIALEENVEENHADVEKVLKQLKKSIPHPKFGALLRQHQQESKCETKRDRRMIDKVPKETPNTNTTTKKKKKYASEEEKQQLFLRKLFLLTSKHIDASTAEDLSIVDTEVGSVATNPVNKNKAISSNSVKDFLVKLAEFPAFQPRCGPWCGQRQMSGDLLDEMRMYDGDENSLGVKSKESLDRELAEVNDNSHQLFSFLTAPGFINVPVTLRDADPNHHDDDYDDYDDNIPSDDGEEDQHPNVSNRNDDASTISTRHSLRPVSRHSLRSPT